MSLYKLLKDTPTIKAGTIFREVVSDYDGARKLARITPIGAKTSPQFTIQDIDNFEEWFEGIEEPIDSIHWKPKIAEKYFYINECGDVEWEVWSDDDLDNRLMAMGLVYRTEEECEKAKERRLAKVRLERTSNFKPDFENGKGGWIVFYSYMYKELRSMRDSYTDSGEPVRYETEEEAKRSIRENREDWLIYFGIEEEK
jgi:hypothetical protein